MRLSKIVFLDRDGVINKNPPYTDYIKKISEFRFIPGSRQAIKMLTQAGFEIFIISNQAGVAKGLFSKKDLNDINKKMLEGVRSTGGRIKKAYYCIHHPDANCGCRKPDTGLIKKAVGKRRISRRNSFFIGDTERDVIVGHKISVNTVMVLSGYATRKDIKGWKIKPDLVANNLLEAAVRILNT
jgi:D-glycero-D-manno-heptose 1,7-bisphosphate phosphatase